MERVQGPRIRKQGLDDLKTLPSHKVTINDLACACLAVTAHNGKTAQGSRLSRQAVASLCIEALSNPLSHNATVSCAWGVSSRAYGEEGGQPEGGADNLSSVFVGADTYENTRRAHSHTVGAVVWGSLGSVVLSLVLAGVITMERIDKAVKFGPWIAVPSFIYARKRDRSEWS